MSSSSAALIGPSVEAPDAVGVFRVWPGQGVPPGSEGWTFRESTMQVPWSSNPMRLSRNIVVPSLTLFKPETPNGTAMIIAPGGAFHFLMVDHEGYDMARWLAARGVTAFVLKYRLERTPDADADLLAFRDDMQRRLSAARSGKSTEPSPITEEVRRMGEDDGRQAVRFVRQHAAEWGVDPQKIGFGGFSAGGGVTMGVLMDYDASSRPDFAVPVYAAPSPVKPVPADAPPIFITISDDDMSVSPVDAAELYVAWRKAGKPAELHVFGNGGHGWGMKNEGFLSDVWIELFGKWLVHRGLMANA